jgi:hypothetical protein
MPANAGTKSENVSNFIDRDLLEAQVAKALA